MKVTYHIPCFYFDRGSLQACFNEDFKAELTKKIHTTDTDYIQLQTVKVERNGVFVDEELLTFYLDDLNFAEKLQTTLDIFADTIEKYQSDLCQERYLYEYNGVIIPMSKKAIEDD